MPRGFPRQRGIGDVEEAVEIVERRGGAREGDLRGTSAVVLRRARNPAQPIEKTREELRESVALVLAAQTDRQGDGLHGAPRPALFAASNVGECGCDTIGFLGGQTGPLIEKFEAGYTAGAEEINPDINVLVEYIGDDVSAFNDPVKGEALSTKMYDAGAEVIFHASGASGAGLFNAAVKANKLAIGVDSDQYLTASPEQQPLILTSMIKRVDTAVYDSIKSTGDGSFAAGGQVFGLAEDGIDYSKSNTDLMTQDIIDQLDAFKQQIIDGDITVPDTPS